MQKKTVTKCKKLKKKLTLAAGAAGSREAGGQLPRKGGQGRPGRSRASAKGHLLAPAPPSTGSGQDTGRARGRGWWTVPARGGGGMGWWCGEGAERGVVAAARRRGGDRVAAVAREGPGM